MQEDIDAGLILAFMLDNKVDKVCSKQFFKEVLHNEFTQPQRWQTNEMPMSPDLKKSLTKRYRKDIQEYISHLKQPAK